MKETYKVKAPKSIIIGDPWYFEQYSGDELDRLTVMETVPPWLNEARVTLEEKTCEEFPDLKFLGMSIYIAPKQTIDTYLGGMMYGAQMSVDKTIGVDTAKYTLQISDEITELKEQIKILQEQSMGNEITDERIREIQNAIDNENLDFSKYDDGLVRQTIECIRIYDNKKIDIIFGGGYVIEEML